MNSLSVDAVMADSAALLQWLSGVAAADPDRVCALGFCMTGRFAMAALHRFAGTVRAPASVYGTEVMTEGPDRPHLLAAQANSRLYVAIAELYEYALAAQPAPMRAAFPDGAAVAATEIFPGVCHGFYF